MNTFRREVRAARLRLLSSSDSIVLRSPVHIRYSTLHPRGHTLGHLGPTTNLRQRSRHTPRPNPRSNPRPKPRPNTGLTLGQILGPTPKAPTPSSRPNPRPHFIDGTFFSNFFKNRTPTNYILISQMSMPILGNFKICLTF